MADRDVIAEPVLRLRAELSSLKADLDKAKDLAKSATGDMKAAADANVSALEKKLASVGASLSKAERAAAKEAKAIQGHLDRLNATKANASIELLEKAVQKAGGTSKLSAEQLAILTRQVERLAAAGAKVPAALSNLPKPGVGGLGAGIQAGLANAQQSLISSGPGGAIGAGLAAIGPAGLIAAGAIGAVTVAAVSAGKALADLASKAEQWTNTATATGLGVHQVQQLEAFLEDAGFEAGDLQKAMKKLETEIAIGGDSLAKFGIDVRELKGLAPEEQLRELARQVTAIVDPTERAAAATEAFGKGGARALAALQGIAQGTYRDLHALTQQQIDDLLRVDQALDEASRGWKNFNNEAVVALVEAAKALDAFLKRDFLKNIKDFVRGGPGALAAGVALDATARPPGAAGQASGRDPTIAAFEAQIEQRRKAAALAKRKEDEEEAKRRAKAEPEAFRSALASANEALEATRAKIAATFDPGDIAAKLAAISAATAAEIQKVQDQIEKVKVNKDLFAPDKEKIIAVYEAQIQKLKELDEEQKKVALHEAAKASAEAFEKRQLAEIKMARESSEANRQMRADFEATTGVFQRLLSAAQNIGAPAAAAQIGLEELAKDVATLGGVSKLTADQLDVVKEKIARLQSQGATKLPDSLKTVVDHTKVWIAALDTADAILSRIGGRAGSIGSIFGGLASGLSGIKAFQEASKKGGLEGVLGKLGAAGSIASAAIGIGSAIVGLFKSDPVKKAQQEAGRALGYGISRELAQTLLDEAKASGKTISQVAREYAAKVKAEQDKANLETLRGGVELAKGGAQTLLSILDQLSPKAQAAGNALVKAVADAMAANGLGVLATGALGKSEKFGAVQTAVQGAGQVFQGLRQAGGISTDLLQNGGALAEALKTQAIEAAKEAGLSDAEAQKAGIAAVAPLLRDQLEASIQSGQKLSAQTQQLIDEAKANGITIVADPMIELLGVQKESLALQKGRAGTGTGAESRGPKAEEFAGGSGGFRDFGRGTPAILHGIEAVVPKSDLSFGIPELLRSGGSFQGWNDALERGIGAGARNEVSTTIERGGITIVQQPGQSPQAVADALFYMLERRDHKVNAILDRRYGGR